MWLPVAWPKILSIYMEQMLTRWPLSVGPLVINPKIPAGIKPP